MSYQSGNFPLTSAVVTYTVPFGAAFTVIPTIVIAVVSNVSGDGTKLSINAPIVGKTTTGFTIKLDVAPNTGNYVLEWIAGDASTFFQAVSVLGRRTSELRRRLTYPSDNSYLAFVNTADGLPVTETLAFSAFRSVFVRRVSAPSGPASPGEIGDYAIDTTYVYLHNGVLWGRIGLQTQLWSTSSTWSHRRSGQFALPQGNQAPVVPFGASFATVPKITSLVLGNTVPGANLFLAANVAAVTLTNVTLVLNAPPNNVNYYVNWTAEI